MRFENSKSGRDSKVHKKTLKEKIKEKIYLNSLAELSLKELNDKAEILIEQYKEHPLNGLRKQLLYIRDILRRKNE